MSFTLDLVSGSVIRSQVHTTANEMIKEFTFRQAESIIIVTLNSFDCWTEQLPLSVRLLLTPRK